MSFSLLLWSPAGSLAAGSAAGVAVRDLTFTVGIGWLVRRHAFGQLGSVLGADRFSSFCESRVGAFMEGVVCPLVSMKSSNHVSMLYVVVAPRAR